MQKFSKDKNGSKCAANNKQFQTTFHWQDFSLTLPWLLVQELSYRKQIAHQLRTQRFEDIYRPKYYTVTLKSRLRVIHSHWKRNHWTDHKRLAISRVVWRWILSWPWNEDQMSRKVIESGTIWKLRYGILLNFHSSYGCIFSHFGDIQHQRMAWVLTLKSGFWGPSS